MIEQITVAKCGNKFFLSIGANPKEIFESKEEAENIKEGLQLEKKRLYNKNYRKIMNKNRIKKPKLTKKEKRLKIKEHYKINQERLKKYQRELYHKKKLEQSK